VAARSADDQIERQGSNGNSVSPDRSYSNFVWQETGAGIGGGELHVVLRGYPGRRRSRPAAPAAWTARTCRASTVRVERSLPADHRPALLRPNQDRTRARRLLWRKGGTLYTLSEHVAPR